MFRLIPLLALCLLSLAATNRTPLLRAYLQSNLDGSTNAYAGSGHLITNLNLLYITNAGTAAYSNSAAFYLNSNPSNYITAADLPEDGTGHFVVAGTNITAETNGYAVTVNAPTYGTAAYSNAPAFYLSSNPSNFITSADLPTYGTAAYSNAVDFYLSSNPSNYVSWTESSNLSFYVSQSSTNGQWLSISNVDYDLQVQIDAITGTPTNGITAETATNIARAMAKEATNVIAHGSEQYDQGATNYVLIWESSLFHFAECPDLYLDDAGTLYVTGIAGPGNGLTGITSNSIASSTDAVYRQDTVGNYVAAGENATATTNGNLVTIGAVLDGGGHYVTPGANVTMSTNSGLVTVAATQDGVGHYVTPGTNATAYTNGGLVTLSAVPDGVGHYVVAGGNITLSTNGNAVTITGEAASDGWDSDTTLLCAGTAPENLVTNVWTGTIATNTTMHLEAEVLISHMNGTNRYVSRMGQTITSNPEGITVDTPWSWNSGNVAWSTPGNTVSTGGTGIAYQITLLASDFDFRIRTRIRTSSVNNP